LSEKEEIVGMRLRRREDLQDEGGRLKIGGEKNPTITKKRS